MFFVDDAILRALGLSLPPFDMFWLVETLEERARAQLKEETAERTRSGLKELRLLFELGDMTRKEYEDEVNRLSLKLNTSEISGGPPSVHGKEGRGSRRPYEGPR